MEPLFFTKPEELRAWFQANGAIAAYVWLGFYKKSAKLSGISYEEALDEAICFGWIDVLVKGIDEHCYMMRFVPRRPKGNWTAANQRKAEELIASGRMQPAGLAAFEARKASPN